MPTIKEGRHLDAVRIQTILSPALQTTCRLKPEEVNFFPPPLTLGHITSFRTTAYPTRPLPTSPATYAAAIPTGPSTPPQEYHTVHSSTNTRRKPRQPASTTIAPTGLGYTSSQPPPSLVATPSLTEMDTIGTSPQRGPPPTPHPWTPRFIPEN